MKRICVLGLILFLKLLLFINMNYSFPIEDFTNENNDNLSDNSFADNSDIKRSKFGENDDEYDNVGFSDDENNENNDNHASMDNDDDDDADDDDDENLGEYGEYFEGDMILTPEQNLSLSHPEYRNGVLKTKYRWPDARVFYEISKEFDKEHIEYIHKGMRVIEGNTCVRFYKRPPFIADYIHITGKQKGCFASVGRHGGKQKVNYARGPIGKKCFRIGTIMHELVHALGFHHQQSASNRDEYVKIVKQNIRDKKFYNFRKYPKSEITDFGVPYDYESVMHYSRRAFSKNGKDTVIPLKPDVKIGQRTHLSKKDIEKINRMYNCRGKKKSFI